MSDQSTTPRPASLVLSGASLRAAVMAAENPLLKGMLRGRFFQQMRLSEVLSVDLRAVDEQLRPAALPLMGPPASSREG